MTKRLPCPPARARWRRTPPSFDDLFGRGAAAGLPEYLAGLLPPRERNKTLTALANTEPVVGAQHPAAQRLQWFLSESTWAAAQLNARRLELLRADPATAPHAAGCWSSTSTGIARTGPRPRTWAGSTWADRARPTAAWSR